MVNLHLAEDRSSVVRHGDFSIGGNEYFVQSYAVCLSIPLIFQEGREEPLGPSDVRMMLATVLAARICCCEFIGSE